MLLVLAFGLTTLTATFTLILLTPPTLIGKILAFGGLCMAQIVILSVVLSELGQIGRIGFLLGHGVLLIMVGWGVARSAPTWAGGIRGSLSKMSLWGMFTPMVVLFGVGVLAISIFNLAYSWGNLPLSGDAYNYHLPRSYFWAEFQTAHHFETPFTFMNEYPPNPSFYFMWIMLMRGDFGDWGLQVPQWLAGWMCAVALMGWVRLMGKTREQALFVGLTALTLPMMSAQMRSIEIDLLTTCVGLGSIYFMLAYLQNPHRAHLVYGGMLFGLFLGSKYTAFFTLPPLAILLVGYSWTIKRENWFKPLVNLGISALIGFFFLGSYHYWVNLFTVGNPISSRSAAEATAGVDQDRLDDYFSPSGNAVRYSYMMMDWGILPRGNELAALHTEIYQGIEGALGTDLEDIFKFSWEDYGSGRRQPNRLGFGVVGYAAYLLSPFVLLVALYRFWKRRQAEDWLQFSYVLLGLGWIVGFIIAIPWDPYRMRYFPLAILPLLTWLGDYKWVRVGVMVFSLWIGADAARFAFNHAEIQDLRELYALEIDILEQTLPANSRIAFVDPSIPYITISQLPDFHYQIFLSDGAEERFEAGEADVILETIQPGKSTDFQNRDSVAIYLPELIFNVRVHDPEAFRERFQSIYGMDETGMAYHPERLIQQDDGRLTVNILDELFMADDDFVIQLNPAPKVENIMCEGQPLEYQQRGEDLLLYWMPDLRAPYQLFQSCELTLRQTAAPIQKLMLQPDQVPPPQVEADLWFNGELNYQGLVMTDGFEFEKCGAVPVVSWWSAPEALTAEYSISIVMANEAGEVVSRDDRGLRPKMGDFFRRQLIPVPCELPSGLYDLKMGLYDVASLQDYSINYADGSPHERGVHLTTVFVK